MKNSSRHPISSHIGKLRRHIAPRWVVGASMVLGLAFGVLAQPVPLSNASFSEGGGSSTTNAGSLGGVGSFARQNGFPAFVQNSPVGPYAPPGNGGSIDFGTIVDAADGNRAVDFPGSLGALNGFTVCGWVNCRDLSVGWGGNRIVFALIGENSSGFDLVQLANGSLQLGINQWPDASTAISSPGKITADPNAGVDNWVFLAVTYDGTLASDQASFYFGNGNTPAALDVTKTYNRGALPASGTLTVGNFGSVAGARVQTGAGGNSRCFRGLFDEIQVFPTVLSLAQIQTVQTNPALPQLPLTLLTEPVSRAILSGQDATFSVSVSGGFPISYRWQRNEVDIPDATNASYTVAAATVTDSGARFRAIVSNPINTVTTSNATLYVNADGTAPMVVAVTPLSRTNLLISFSEPVETGSAEDASNYVLGDGSINLYGVVLQPNLTNVLLTTDLMTTGAVYTITVQFIFDRALPIANMLEPTNVVFTAYTTPPPPRPIIELSFDETSGTAAINNGLAGGSLNFSSPVPYRTNNAPVGVGGSGSVDFRTSTGNYYIESPTNYPQLAGLTKFTIAGWVNNRSTTEGGGGNRVVTWINHGGNGVDVVYKTDGSLQVGINQWPDNTPARSTAGMITTDASASAGNWRFFAITYDSSLSSGQLSFYFGSNEQDATLDKACTYARGAVGSSIHRLCVGHFNSATRSGAQDRMFRGLIDEIRVFGDALVPEQIVAVQRGSASASPVGFTLQPQSQSVTEGQPVNFSVVVTGTPPIAVQWQRNNTDIPGASDLSYSIPAASMADNGATFRVAASNKVGRAFSSAATLTVIRDTTAPTVLSVTPARTTRNLTNLTVVFSEPVDAGSAQEPGNYTLNGGALATISAVLQPDQKTVLLTVNPLTPDAACTLNISGVSDRAGAPNTIAAINWAFNAPRSILPPAVELRFEEISGTAATNSGTLGGLAPFAQQTGYPIFSTNVPAGPYAPSASLASVDFGDIASGQGNRAVDLTTALGPNGTVGAMDAFTICGWLNARSLNEGWGGNRIVFALTTGNGPGFDIVQLASGSLRIGVNQWPDDGLGGPISSPKITADPLTGPTNWVFFAVTYDSAVNGGEICYYFGKPDAPLELDKAVAYPRGPILNTGKLTVGNFSPVDSGARGGLGAGGPSRVFRGLIDEFQVFEDAFPIERLRQIQLSAPAAPQLTIQRAGSQYVISWTSVNPFQLQYRQDIHQGAWQNEAASQEVSGNTRTVRVEAAPGTRFFRLISQ